MEDGILICDRSGAIQDHMYAELPEAKVTRVNWPLAPFAQPGNLSFEVPTLDPKWSEIKVWAREAQYWINGKCKFWGPILRKRGNKTVTRVECLHKEEYFQRKFIGPTPALTEFGHSVTAGPSPGASVHVEFPTFSEWATTGCTKTVSGEGGMGYLELTNTAGPGEDAFVEKHFDITSGGPGIMPNVVTLHLRGWFKMMTGMATAAFMERGLYGQTQFPIGLAVFDEQWASIPYDFVPPKHFGLGTQGWTRLETSIIIPTDDPAKTSRVFTRLYSPEGVIRWAGVNWFQERSVGSNGGEVIDYSIIIERLLDYASGSTSEARGLGKSNLQIGRAIESAGIVDDLAFRFQENTNVASALSDFTDRGQYDFGITYDDDGTDPQVEGWAPNRGAFQVDYPLEIELDPETMESSGNILDFEFNEDGSQTTTCPRVKGDASGIAADIYEVADDSVTGPIPGLRIESVDSAPQEAPFGHVRALTGQTFVQKSQPVKIPSVTVSFSEYVGIFNPGDTVSIKIVWGGIDFLDVLRITNIEGTPLENLLKLELNDE